MYKNNDSGSTLSIAKRLRRDPDRLLVELVEQGGDKEWTRIKIDSIGELIEKEASAQLQRKRLSRQIGVAKRQNENVSDLIDEVSKLTACINDTNLQLTSQVAELELAQNDGSPINDPSNPRVPNHLLPLVASEPLDSAVVEDLTFCSEKQLSPQEWQQFIEENPRSTIYHDPRWKAVIEKNFEHDLHIITCRDHANQLVGILPLCHLKSRIFGSFTISMPYFNYGGPIALTPDIEEALLSHGALHSERLGCSHMEIREVHARKRWKTVQRKVSMILPLPGSDHSLDASLGAKIRAQIKKARSNHLEVRFGGMELLDHFYVVFSHNMRDLGTPVYSKQFFADIMQHFPDSAFIAITYQGHKPLAVGFLLGHRDKLEIPWASSLRRQNYLGANMLMYREILKEAISRQYNFFDFGRSTINANTYRFKKQWGAVEHPLYWHYWTRQNHEVPEINPDNPKYKLVIRVWQMLPVLVTRFIGPLVAKNLP